MLGTEHRAFDVVVLAGSHGALEPLRELVRRLPATFPAAVVAVVHRAPHRPDLLPELVAHQSPLPVRTVEDDCRLEAAAVHVAGASVDVLIPAPGRLAVRPAVRSPARVSADVLFGSAAAAYGPRALGIVLSGRLDDGAVGVRQLRQAGGRVVVQSPADASAPGMPAAALATGCVDFALPAPAIAAAVTSLVMAPGAAELFRVRPHPGVPIDGGPVSPTQLGAVGADAGG